MKLLKKIGIILCVFSVLFVNFLTVFAHSHLNFEVGMTYEEVLNIFEDHGFSLSEVNGEAYDYLYRDFFERFSTEEVDAINSRMVNCCIFGPSFVWRNPRFFVNFDARGICISYHTFADRVCSSCGAVWERQVFLESRVGCGRHQRYHMF